MKILKKKCIILNIHNFENLFKIRSLDFEIFLTLRNPISSLNSSTVHWLNYSRKKRKFVVVKLSNKQISKSNK